MRVLLNKSTIPTSSGFVKSLTSFKLYLFFATFYNLYVFLNVFQTIMRYIVYEN